MVWGLTDLFVGEVIAFYPSRAQAERALTNVLRDEPGWKGMLEVVSVPDRRRCPASCRDSLRCRRRRVTC
jgi:hypothetical protein